MKQFLLICLMTFFHAIHAHPLYTDTNYVMLSQLFLYSVRTGDSSDHYIQKLKTADRKELHRQLPTDAYKKAFWLNIYNAFVQKLLTENPENYKSRNSFFSGKQMVIAGTRLSLDDIEHGILRRSKIKWSLGYLNKLFHLISKQNSG